MLINIIYYSKLNSIRVLRGKCMTVFLITEIQKVSDMYSRFKVLSITEHAYYDIFKTHELTIYENNISSGKMTKTFKLNNAWDFKCKFMCKFKNNLLVFCEEQIKLVKEKYAHLVSLNWNNNDLKSTDFIFLENLPTDKKDIISVPTDFKLLENYLQVDENIIYAYCEDKLYVITIDCNKCSFDYDFVIKTDAKILNIIKKSCYEICIILSSEILIFNIHKSQIVKRISTNEPWIFSFFKNSSSIHKIDMENYNLETIQLLYQPVQKLTDVCFAYY